MPAPENLIKSKLLQGTPQIGAFLNVGAKMTAEIAGRAGYDWCLVDAEHGVNDVANVRAQLTALASVGCPSMVRVPVNETWVLKQMLDIGAQSLLIPMVDDAAQARAAVAATRYAPQGKRGLAAGIVRASGYGHIDDYMHTANDQICVMVQAETRAAVENIDAIAAVEGVDCVFVGPSDLAADMGLIGQTTHPEVMAAIARVADRTRAAGKAVGIFCLDTGALSAYAEMGMSVFAVASDVVTYRAGMMATAKAARAALT